MTPTEPPGPGLDVVLHGDEDRDVDRAVDVEDVVDLARLDALVDEAVRAATPASTRIAYLRDVHRYAAWCQAAGVDPLDHTSVARFIVAMGELGYKITTIERGFSALCVFFKELGEPSPRQNMRVIRALKGTRNRHPHVPRRARALGRDELARILDHLPDTLQGHRDRVALLLGHQGALRRSELVAVDVQHVTEVPEGLVLYIPRSKTDQDAIGTEIGIPAGIDATSCPVAAVNRWLGAAHIQSGPLLRAVDRWGNVSERRMTPRSIGILLTRTAEQAGVSTQALSAHSLRAGFATSAATVATERSIAAHGRWRSVAVLRTYVRHASLFVENPVRPLGSPSQAR